MIRNQKMPCGIDLQPLLPARTLTLVETMLTAILSAVRVCAGILVSGCSGSLLLVSTEPPSQPRGNLRRSLFRGGLPSSFVVRGVILTVRGWKRGMGQTTRVWSFDCDSRLSGIVLSLQLVSYPSEILVRLRGISLRTRKVGSKTWQIIAAVWLILVLPPPASLIFLRARHGRTGSASTEAAWSGSRSDVA